MPVGNADIGNYSGADACPLSVAVDLLFPKCVGFSYKTYFLSARGAWNLSAAAKNADVSPRISCIFLAVNTNWLCMHLLHTNPAFTAKQGTVKMNSSLRSTLVFLFF